LFNAKYVQAILEVGAHLSVPDLVATVTQLTIETITEAIQRFLPRLPECIIVGGGGGHNRTMLSGLQAALPSVRCVSHEAFGIPSDAKESLAFALLAAATLNHIPANVPSATGARGPRILGSITYP
jgi:anhydro-N-acetylmuramic acid kinase